MLYLKRTPALNVLLFYQGKSVLLAKLFLSVDGWTGSFYTCDEDVHDSRSLGHSRATQLLARRRRIKVNLFASWSVTLECYPRAQKQTRLHRN